VAAKLVFAKAGDATFVRQDSALLLGKRSLDEYRTNSEDTSVQKRLEGSVQNAEEEIESLVRNLTEKAGTLSPEDDDALRAFVDLMEREISIRDFSTSSKFKAALHGLAANALTRMSKQIDEEQLRRALAHIDAVEALRSPSHPELRRMMQTSRAQAFQRFGDLKSEPTIDRALQAFSDALQLQGSDGNDALAGMLAYNAGELQLKLNALAGRVPDPARACSFFETAYQRYRRAGKEKEAFDAAFYLSQLLLEQLRTAPLGSDDRRRIFQRGWRLVAEVIVGLDITVDLRLWGQCNELAASFLVERPGHSRTANVAQAAYYLDQALNAYRQVGDREFAGLCAARMLQEVPRLPPSYWTESLAQRSEFHLAVLKEALQDADEPQLLYVGTITAADVWLKASSTIEGEGRANALAHARTLAGEAHALATKLNDHRRCGYALVLFGRTFLSPKGSAPIFNAAESESPSYDCEGLTAACASLEDAVRHARAAGDNNLLAQALVLLLAAVAGRITSCGEMKLLEQCIAVAREAMTVSSGRDRSLACINLASALIPAIEDGQRQYIQAARDALAAVSMDELEASHAAYAESLTNRLDEFLFVGPNEMAAADNLFTADGKLSSSFQRPDHIFFKVYKVQRETLSETGKPIHVMTILLSLQDDGRADGRMNLASDGSTVSATFDIACPHCKATNKINFPMSIPIDENPAFIKRFEAIERGGETCLVCKEAIQVQFFLIARDRRFSENHIVAYPDIFRSRAPRLSAQQTRVIWAVHEAWLERRVHSAVQIPWSGMIAVPVMRSDAAFGLRRQAALAAIALGLLSRDVATIAHGLSSDPSLWKKPATLQIDEIGAVLSSVRLPGQKDLQRGDLAALAGQMNQLLTVAHDRGSAKAVDLLRLMFEAATDNAGEVEEAMEVAANCDARRRFLRNFIAEMPDYSPERVSTFYYLYGLFDSEREVKRMAAEGASENDLRYQGSLALLRGLRDGIRDLIEKDKEENSSVRAKSVIAKALDDNKTKPVLLLRAFSLEVTNSPPSQSMRDMVNEKDPRIGWRVSKFELSERRAISAVLNAISNEPDLIMVANVQDAYPPPGLQKLLVSDLEWRQVVFSLIAEAGAIVFILPANAREISPGVLQEIGAIRSLNRETTTIMVVMTDQPEDDTDIIMDTFVSTRVEAKGFDDTGAYLNDFGFLHVISQDELEKDPGILRKHLDKCLGRVA
jgi:hypothetical protein